MKVLYTGRQAGILTIPTPTSCGYTTTHSTGIIITSIVFVVLHRLGVCGMVQTGEIELGGVAPRGVLVRVRIRMVRATIVVKLGLLLLLFSLTAL